MNDLEVYRMHTLEAMLLRFIVFDLSCAVTKAAHDNGAENVGLRGMLCFLPDLVPVMQGFASSDAGRRLVRGAVQDLRGMLRTACDGAEMRNDLFQVLAAEWLNLVRLREADEDATSASGGQRASARLKARRARIGRTRLRWFDRFAARFNTLADAPLVDAFGAAVLLLAFALDGDLRRRLRSMDHQTEAG